jgi:hypothetical protein
VRFSFRLKRSTGGSRPRGSNPLRAQVTIRLTNDSTTTTDVVTRSNTVARPLTETVTPTENLGRRAVPGGARYSFRLKRAGGGSRPRGGNYLRAQLTVRLVAETLTTSDVATRVAILPRAITETVTPSAAETHIALHRCSVSDNASVVETPTTALMRVRSLGESLSAVTDALSLALKRVRALADSSTTSEAPTSTHTTPHTAVDDISSSFSDAVTRSSGVFVRGVAETLTTSDALTSNAVAIRAISDDISGSFGEAVTRIVGIGGVFDNISGLTDVPTRIFTGTRVWVEIVFPTEVPTRALTLVRSVDETLTTSDALTINRNWFVTGSDSTTTSDALTTKVIRYRALSDTVTPSDATTSQEVNVRATADSTTTSDAVARSRTVVRSGAEIVVYVPESLLTPSLHSRATADTVTTPTDAVTTPTRLFLRSAADTLVTSDSATHSGTFFGRTAADTFATSDALARRTVLGRIPTDTVTPTDVAIGARNLPRSGTDTVTPNATVARSILFVRTAADSVAGIIDTPIGIGAAHVNRSASDTVTPSATVVSVAVHVRVPFDAVTPLDTASRSTIRFRSASDVLPSPTDSVAANGVSSGFFVRTASDSSYLIEYPFHTRGHLVIRTASETLATPQDVVTTGEPPAFVEDSAEGIDDLATRRVTFHRATSDIAPVSANTVVRHPSPCWFRPSDGHASVDDTATRHILLHRTAAETVTPASGVTRKRKLVRTTADTVTPNAVLSGGRLKRRTASESLLTPATAVLAAVSHGSGRKVAEHLTILDSAIRNGSKFFRTANDIAAVVSNVVTGGRLKKRTASDTLAAPVTVATRKKIYVVHVSEHLTPPVEKTKRVVTIKRNWPEVVTPSSLVVGRQRLVVRRGADAPGALSDGPARRVVRHRAVQEIITHPVARPTVSVGHLATLAQPILATVSAGETVVSRVTGYSSTTVDLSFNQPVTGWVIRVGGSNPYDGALAAESSGTHTRVADTATLTSDSAVRRGSSLKVYARNIDGDWAF